MNIKFTESQTRPIRMSVIKKIVDKSLGSGTPLEQAAVRSLLREFKTTNRIDLRDRLINCGYHYLSTSKIEVESYRPLLLSGGIING